MNLSGTVWLNRSNRKDAVMAMQGAAEEMKEKGVSVLSESAADSLTVSYTFELTV